MNEIVVVNVKRASVASGQNCFALCALGCVGMCACACVYVIRQWHLFFYSGNHINEIALLFMQASVKQFETQDLKWCDLVTLVVVLIRHTTLEMVQFGHFISCLKLYESERSKHKKNVTYNIWIGAIWSINLLFKIVWGRAERVKEKFDIQDLKWCNLVCLFVV
jgi:hypothetical protein